MSKTTTTRTPRAKTTNPTKTAAKGGTQTRSSKATGKGADKGTGRPANRDQPIYAQVADQLRDLIESGQLPPASLLPSESQLMARFDISRPTARNAIAALRRQGLVTVISGKGAVVRRLSDRPAHTHHRTITHTPATGRRAQASAGSYTDDDTDRETWREVEAPATYWVKATPALALAVGVAEHTPLFTCDRLLEDPAGRRVLHRVYLPFTTVDEVPELEADPFITPGRLYTLLAKAGHQLTWTENVTARNPTPDDTTTLRIPAETPILTTRRATHTTQSDSTPTNENINPRILAMEETRRGADDTQLTYTIAPHGSQLAD